MDTQRRLSFLIADDHSIVRQGVVLIIEEMYTDAEIHHAATLEQTHDLILNNSFDVAILDIQFQDGNCIDILPEIRKKRPEMRIMMFSSCPEETHALRYYEAGANGYVNKLSDEETIRKALLQIIEKGSYSSPTVQQLFIRKMRDPDYDQPLRKLSERELEVAKLYADGLGNLEIANHLDIKQSTVSTLKMRIFKKLKINNLVELIDLMKE